MRPFLISFVHYYFMQVVQKTAATFAPRASTASKNPAVPGTVLYTVFEVQGYVCLLLGGALSFNLIFPSNEPDLWRLMGMWSIWMFSKYCCFSSDENSSHIQSVDKGCFVAVFSNSFPSCTGLFQERERSSQLSLPPRSIAQCHDPIFLEIICSRLVCRRCSLLWDVCLEGIFHYIANICIPAFFKSPSFNVCMVVYFFCCAARMVFAERVE